MNFYYIIIIIFGVASIFGSANKSVISAMRKLGSVFFGMVPGSSALQGVYNNNDKNYLIRVILIIFGFFLIILSLLAIIL